MGPKRIGELLVAANIIQADTLVQALKVAKESKSPIGRTLMSMGMLNERDLEAAIELQGWLRDGIISTEFGVRALNLAIKGKISLDESFSKLGWQPPKNSDAPKNDLAELLLEAGIVSFQVLETALEESNKNHMSLGHVLVFNNVVTNQMLSSILTAQVLLRDGKISKGQAISALRQAVRKQQTIEETLSESGKATTEATSVRLGDLLASAELISEDDKVSAIEIGLTEKRPLGEILVGSNMISQAVLDEGLTLQKRVSESALSVDEAAQALRQSQTGSIKMSYSNPQLEIDTSVVQQASQALEVLKQLGILSEEQIIQANNLAETKNVTLCQTLIENGLLDESIIIASSIASNLVNDEIINIDQAKAILSYCSKEKAELHKAFLKVDWLEH